MRILSTILCLALLPGCAALSGFSQADQKQITGAALNLAIERNKEYANCGYKYFYVGSKTMSLDSESLSSLKHEGIVILPQTGASTSCDTGITSSNGSERGLALSVFEITRIDKFKAEVKWGHWFSCKDHSSHTTIFQKQNNVWLADVGLE